MPFETYGNRSKAKQTNISVYKRSQVQHVSAFRGNNPFFCDWNFSVFSVTACWKAYFLAKKFPECFFDSRCAIGSVKRLRCVYKIPKVVALKQCSQIEAITIAEVTKTELSTSAISWRTAEAADKRDYKNGGILVSRLDGRCRIYAAM